ncbi:hypothetical protein NRB16_25605 [Pseudomonas sp. LJDD11]|uniref:DUF6124 family protein n=1 Tax=Pseudomonas sp. LJDD11 TaxID=2931984 RepID=UPI00211CCFB9|nr:hypothetical protein [Pseudomonas sp. LJDD11]MCQ9426893.1 hypothetical protein [Pseudomonas sp. LJDD11]
MVNDTFDKPGSKTLLPVLNQSIVERALAHYLPATDVVENNPATIPPHLETTLLHALDFLRCAAATSCELGEGLSGAQRSLAFSSMHMAEMARVMVERSLACVEQP